MPMAPPSLCSRQGCTSTVRRPGPCEAHATRVTLVCGPPGAGKTTYVRERAQHGDLIVDLDALWTALAGTQGHDRPIALLPFASAARDAVLARLTRDSDVRQAWVIAMAPTPTERISLASRLRASDVVVLATDQETCQHRTADRHGTHWAAAIAAWHREYQP